MIQTPTQHGVDWILQLSVSCQHEKDTIVYDNRCILPSERVIVLCLRSGARERGRARVVDAYGR